MELISPLGTTMSQSEASKNRMPTAFEKGWLLEDYYGWRVLPDEQEGIKHLVKKYGFIERHLILCDSVDSKIIEKFVSDRNFGWRVAEVIVHRYGALEATLEGFEAVEDRKRILSKATFVVDLRLSEEKLWEALHDNAKGACKKSLKDGFVFGPATSGEAQAAAIDFFFNQYAVMAKERGLTMPERSIVEKIVADKRAVIFTVSDKEKKIVATNIIYLVNQIGFFMYGVIEQGRNVNVGQFPHWEAMKYLKHQGYHYYDLGGVNQVSEGIFKFKRSLGGVYADESREFSYTKKWVKYAKKIKPRF